MKFDEIKEHLKSIKCPDILMTDDEILTEHFFEKTQKILGLQLYKEGFEIDDIFESVGSRPHKKHYDLFMDLLDLFIYIKECRDVAIRMLDDLDKHFIFYELNNKMEFFCNSMLVVTKNKDEVLEFLKDKLCSESEDKENQKVRVFDKMIGVFSGETVGSMQMAHRDNAYSIDAMKKSTYKAFKEFDLSLVSCRRFMKKHGLEKSKFMRIYDLYEGIKDSIKENPESFILSGMLIYDLKNDGDIL
jgi:hypothetical protein